MNRRTAFPWIAALTLLLCSVFACSSPRVGLGETFSKPLGEGRRVVAVEEFELATEVQNYDASPELVGIIMAQRVVHHLRRNGLDAFVYERGKSVNAAHWISGRVVKLDGGSAAKRMWVGLGTGGSVLGIEAQLNDASGTAIDALSTERRSALQLSAARNIDRCSDTIGSDIAEKFSSALRR
jgi:hypothetical protein